MSEKIIMCSDSKCPLRKQCHRFSIRPQKGQSFFLFSPREVDNKLFVCDMFWGDSSQLLFEQLKEIVKSENKD